MGALALSNGDVGNVRPDVGINEQNVSKEKKSSFKFNKSTGSVLSHVRNGVDKVAKGAAVVTGVGVVGIMAGTTALAVKSYNKKDELCASVGESMSYYLARMLYGNDHMGVQRLQQAGMKGVETAVQNKKAMNKAVRPLPTLNMPVAPDNQIEY